VSDTKERLKAVKKNYFLTLRGNYFAAIEVLMGLSNESKST
jgi:hypothetical protein